MPKPRHSSVNLLLALFKVRASSQLVSGSAQVQTILLMVVRGDKVSNQNALATTVSQKVGITSGYPTFI
ncbi:hypothetical protein [Nitrincola sp.]|uniref:hypothetical protein n=1 Tax=Nitrincola sp. TaxID=1926584 RepID=UPI003A93FA6A